MLSPLLIITFSEQKFEILKPNTSGREKIRKYLNPEDKLIAIFPRNRTIRRSDKNWNKENYIKLISLLKEKYEDYKIGIFGSPGQAYFDDNIPKGTIDFINLPFDQIMNIQVAALQQSKIAIGSLSGAMVVARGCGVPALTWGLKRDAARFYDENQNNIETIFYPIQYPSYKDIFDLSIDMLDKKIEYNVSYDKWCSESYLKTGNGNKKLLKIKLAEFYHSLFYAKN